MLAQSFKSAEELGISEAELSAHITVLGMLERGELKHVPEPKINSKDGFNMNYSGRNTRCGTVACIGGWVAVLLRRPPDEYVFGCGEEGPRYDLYFPYEVSQDWDDITPAKAASALRNYLTCGEPRWKSVMQISD